MPALASTPQAALANADYKGRYWIDWIKLTKAYTLLDSQPQVIRGVEVIVGASALPSIDRRPIFAFNRSPHVVFAMEYELRHIGQAGRARQEKLTLQQVVRGPVQCFSPVYAHVCL